MGDKIISRHIKDISESNYTFIEYGGNDCDFDWMKIADSPAEDYAPKTSLEEFRIRFVGLIDRIRELGSTPVIISLPPYFIGQIFFIFQQSDDRKAEGKCHKLAGR